MYVYRVWLLTATRFSQDHRKPAQLHLSWWACRRMKLGLFRVYWYGYNFEIWTWRGVVLKYIPYLEWGFLGPPKVAYYGNQMATSSVWHRLRPFHRLKMIPGNVSISWVRRLVLAALFWPYWSPSDLKSISKRSQSDLPMSSGFSKLPNLENVAKYRVLV